MFNNPKFEASVFDVNKLPQKNLPEVVLCGRSNVGKSSFINSLFNRKNLAKTSSTPGKTRSINYYNIDERFYIVDLPGFGYAKASKKEREEWGKIINEFFEISQNIFLAVHFIDSRHEPSELDIRLNEMLKQFAIPYLIILTKIDKVKQSELSKQKNLVEKMFPELSYGDNLLYYSTVKNRGRKEILSRFNHLF